MATPMTDDQRRSFLLDGTRTGILATTRADGSPHAAPVWFTLDGDDVIFTTGAGTVKGGNLRRDGRAVIVVDESTPPFDFVMVQGRVELSEDMDELLRWATVLGGRTWVPTSRRRSAAVTRCPASCSSGCARARSSPWRVSRTRARAAA